MSWADTRSVPVDFQALETWPAGARVGQKHRRQVRAAKNSPCFCLPRLLAGFGSGPPAWEVGGGCGRTVGAQELLVPGMSSGRRSLVGERV